MQTYTGVEFYPFDPRVEDIRIEDIAHSLALQCRFAGHCRTHYSVAEHSVRASRLPYMQLYETRGFNETPLAVLLHDATEAYLVDLPRPVKRDRAFAAYKPIENLLASRIAHAFGLATYALSDDHVIGMADEIMLATEARDVMGKPPRDWHLAMEPDEERIEPWPWERAEREFLARFEELRKAGSRV